MIKYIIFRTLKFLVQFLVFLFVAIILYKLPIYFSWSLEISKELAIILSLAINLIWGQIKEKEIVFYGG